MSSTSIIPNHGEVSSEVPTRTRGRRVGQVVAEYRSRVPVNSIATAIDNLSGHTEKTEE